MAVETIVQIECDTCGTKIEYPIPSSLPEHGMAIHAKELASDARSKGWFFAINPSRTFCVECRDDEVTSKSLIS